MKQAELYVMDLKLMDLPKLLVKQHVLLMHILLYKMVTVKQDGVVVIMIMVMLLNMVLQLVVQQEDHGVIISICKKINIAKQNNNLLFKTLEHIKMKLIEHYVMDLVDQHIHIIKQVVQKHVKIMHILLYKILIQLLVKDHNVFVIMI